MVTAQLLLLPISQSAKAYPNLVFAISIVPTNSHLLLLYAALRDNPQTMEKPATAPWNLRISNKDLQKLKAGFKPQDQDDKWYYYIPPNQQPLTINIARSAFNTLFYSLHIVEKPGEAEIAEIVSITWETKPPGGQTSEEVAKKQVVMVTRAVLECDFGGLPMYESPEDDLPI